MTVINTNNAATITANALTKNERAMSQAMERLSTGVRINSAGDDAAGLAISSRMTSQVNGLNMAVRNANDGISMIQTAEGAMAEVSSMLQRMRELTVQAASGTMSTSDKAALNTEFGALEDQIQEIAKNTEWNGTKILDGSLGSTNIHVGANASQVIAIQFADLNTNYASGGAANTTAGAASDAANATDIFVELGNATAGTAGDGSSTTAEDIDLAAQVITGTAQGTTLGYLDTAIARLDAHRATLGATINRLEYAADNLANVSQNASASRSRILDADYASETTELARTQIIQQAGTAMLSQANQQAQSVLALLR
jgi:flagellin